ncbi:MAG: BrnT family toxin [Chloroflexi bacterium]|nr:BrnT family toxin [Chloroflexota bacterium]
MSLSMKGSKRMANKSVQATLDGPRVYAPGRTDSGRLLSMVFTIRGELVRVVSARDMSKREKKEYERGQSEAADSQDTQV